MPRLNVNEYVRMQIGKKWFPAKVIKIHDDHSYIVQTKDGATYRRNRTLLSKTPEKFPGIGDLALDILQAPDNSETCSPNDLQPVQVEAPPPLYPQPTFTHTRSGRMVKPNKRYCGEEWITK